MQVHNKVRYPGTSTVLTLQEKAVYSALVSEWKRNGRKPFSLYQAHIAEGIGISERSVKSVIKKLKDNGVISIKQVPGKGHSRNLYSIETYLTGDSDNVPNYLEDGSMLLSRDDVDYLFGSKGFDEELDRICY